MKRKLNRKPPPGNVRWAGSTGQNMCGVITNKAGRMVQFESWAERALLLRLDRDPQVRDYGSQPEAFEYLDARGKRHTYTPDFIVWRRDGRVEVHEVTLTQRRLRPDMRQREAAAARICGARGWRYVVHTQQSLPQGSELANLLVLFRYRPTVYANQAVAQAASERLGQDQAVALRSLVRQLAAELQLPEPDVTAALGHMLWHGQLSTDLNRLIFVPDLGRSAPDVRIRLTTPSQEERDVTQLR
jgi:hypothetical protein